MKACRVHALVVALAFLSVVTAACGPAGEATTAPASTTTFPTGKFVSTADQSMAWEFNPDGTWAYYSGSDTPDTQGTYQVQGNVYTELTNDLGAIDPKCQAAATYNWAFDGSHLKFTAVSDACKSRVRAYTAGGFSQQK
jgi:hypothetical protein